MHNSERPNSVLICAVAAYVQSDVSYDTTKALIWFLVAICVVAGAWEIGAVIGGLQMLGTGRRSTRAD